MQQAGRRRRRAATAFVAGYMLVLQLLLGGFMLGAANSGPMLDVFGNPLCITSGEVHHDGSSNSDLPGCCFGPCSMFAPLAGGEPQQLVLENPLPQGASILRPQDAQGDPAAADDLPGNPRAPPLTA
jgi:hypothetical protein